MTFDRSISRFCRQYLQLENHLDYPPDALLKLDEVQSVLYKNLFAHHALSHPPPERYQLKVLKELVAKIEQSIDDWDQYGVSDDLMTSLSNLFLMKLPPETIVNQQKSYVTYTPSLLVNASLSSCHCEPHIALLEHRNILSASGTTGLRTWDAALHLGNYLCAHPHLIRDKRVMELGAGPGYVSILCSKLLGAAHVIASDGSYEVLASLPENVYLNGLQESDQIRPMEYQWGHALLGTEEQEWNGGNPVDVILGADVTYDPSILPPLLSTLQELKDLFPGAMTLIAATERNRDTFERFIRECQRLNFDAIELDFPLLPREDQNGPFFDDNLPIRICKIVRN
ncbi:FAM86A protein [Xylariaceae sp. FL1019]|nr:FAM86A protein [Xylariaceae sp. FL1019]